MYTITLMLPEWMIDVPDCLSQDWYVFARPVGKRCFVVATNGTTVSRLRNGCILHHFPSALLKKAEMSKDAMATVAEKAPITATRKIKSDLDQTKLPKPYLPRALVAADTENVNGTFGHKHNDMSVLQHVNFFDKDKDGIIYPRDYARHLQDFRSLVSMLLLRSSSLFLFMQL